jgi:transcription elongation factor GreA
MTIQDHGARLAAHLAELRGERAQILADIPVRMVGDEADRATNVDGYAHLASLDGRIAAIEADLEAATAPGRKPGGKAGKPGRVSIGSLVGLDFGDGPERFLVASANHGDPDLPVVTPGSPLGRALIGAEVGARLTYQPGPGRRAEVTVTEVG